MFFQRAKTAMVSPSDALPGRDTPVLQQPTFHEIFGTRLDAEPEGTELAHFGLGCFWGVERLFWQVPGVISTAAGYQGGYTPNPTYEEVCSGRTGHAEVVRVRFDPAVVTYPELLALFWENHDPTQHMGQGNDIGTQYRSVILTDSEEQAKLAADSAERAQQSFTEAGFGTVTTEIVPAGPFYYAETVHQQYLDKNPNGYCPIHATGVKCG